VQSIVGGVMLKLFAYGTLQTTGKYYRHFDIWRRSVENAKLEGAMMFDFGDFPGIKHGNSTVYGELHILDEAEGAPLALLDYIKGAAVVPKEKAIFERLRVIVTTPFNAEHEAWTYFCRLPIDNVPVIQDGVWKK